MIDNAQRKGVISSTEQAKYHAIREIRNRAAHDWDFSIESEGVKKHLLFLYESDHSSTSQYIEDLGF
ncbi:hypothetical protein [Aliamphritea spongicola]